MKLSRRRKHNSKSTAGGRYQPRHLARAQFEHAIACSWASPPPLFRFRWRPSRPVLRPSRLAFPRTCWSAGPDIAAAERVVAQAQRANRRSGRGVLSHVTLSASAGFAAASAGKLVHLAEPVLVGRPGPRGNASSTRDCAAPPSSNMRPPTIKAWRTTAKRYSPRFNRSKTIWPLCGFSRRKSCSRMRPWLPRREIWRSPTALPRGHRSLPERHHRANHPARQPADRGQSAQAADDQPACN